MIRERRNALVEVIRQATPDLGDRVVVHSLSEDESPAIIVDHAAVAPVSVAPHPHLINRPPVDGPGGLARAPLGSEGCTSSPISGRMTTARRNDLGSWLSWP